MTLGATLDSVAAGMTTLNYTEGGTLADSLTLLDMATAVAVNLKSDMAAVSVGSKAAASTLSINLADGVDIATSLTVAAATVKPATLNISTAGTTGSFVTAFAAPGATLNLSGTAALTFGTDLATMVKIADTTAALASVDATNLSGALKINLADHITLALTTKGGSAADTIVGSINVINTISGNGGNDNISLSTNAVDGNTLSGNAGDDTIVGGTGADTITGGAGMDTMTGGATGVNTFVFTTGDSTSVSTTWDSITDLKSTDKINLSGYGINGTNGVALSRMSGAKAADGTKDAYIDTSNQTLVIETSDAGGVVTTEKVSIGIAALGALTSNGSGVFTAGPVALSATNDSAGKLTVAGTPIGYINTTIIVDMSSNPPKVDLDGDGATTTTIPSEIIGTNGVTTLDATGLTALGVTVTGSTGADTITGSLTTDTVNAGNGNDTISGGDGVDTLNGEAGVDNITGGEGADTITGGAGLDAIVLTETTAAKDIVVTTIGVAYTTAAADTVTGFKAGSTGGTTLGDVLQIDISDSTAIASLGIVAAGDGATAIAGDLVIKTMTAGTGVILAGTDEIVVISGTLADSAALIASIGTGAGIITKSAANTTTNGLLVVWSDGTNTHVSTVADAGADAAMTSADLSVVDIAVLTGVLTGFDTTNFTAVA